MDGEDLRPRAAAALRPPRLPPPPPPGPVELPSNRSDDGAGLEETKPLPPPPPPPLPPLPLPPPPPIPPLSSGRSTPPAGPGDGAREEGRLLAPRTVSAEPPWPGDCLGGDGRAAEDRDGRRGAALLERLGMGVGVIPSPLSPAEAAAVAPPPDWVGKALEEGVRNGAGDTSAPPPASIRVTGGVGVRDRLVGPALLRSADAEPADARLFGLRVGGMPGRSSIITIGVGLTELLRIRVTRSFVTGPFLDNSSLELTSPTCLAQEQTQEKTDAKEVVHEHEKKHPSEADGKNSNKMGKHKRQPAASAVNPKRATPVIDITCGNLQHTHSSSSVSRRGWHPAKRQAPQEHHLPAPSATPPPAQPSHSHGLTW